MQGSRKLIAACCASFLMLAFATSARASSDAEAVVRGLVDSLQDMASVEPKPELATRVDQLTPVIAAAHDYRRMGRMTLRSHWSGLDADEQAQFIDAFSRLSVATYASRFADASPDTFEVLGADSDGGNTAVVHVLVHRAGADQADAITLDYQLIRSDDGWLIYDVLADGASELSIRRQEYYALFEAGGFDGLLEDIERQVGELR